MPQDRLSSQLETMRQQVTALLDQPGIRRHVDALQQFRTSIDDLENLIHQQAAEDQQRHETHFQALIEYASDISLILKPDGIISYIGPSAQRSLGYRPEDLIGDPIYDYVHPDDREAGIEQFQHRILTPGCHAEPIEIRIRSKAGEWRVFEGATVNLVDDPAIGGLVINARDVTERSLSQQALKASEEKFHAIFELSLDGLALIDKNGKIVEWNRGQEAITGLQRSEVIGQFLWDVMYLLTPDTPQSLDGYNRMKAGTQTWCRTGEAPWGQGAMTVTIKCPDQSKRSVEISVAVLGLEHGRQLAVTTHDITAFKQVEQALRSSEARYRGMIEDQAELVCRWLSNGITIYANEAYCRAFGLKREAVVGSNFLSFTAEDDLPAIREKISALTLNQPLVTCEHRVILPGGEVRWQHWAHRAIFDRRNRITEYQSTGFDITEQVRAQHQLMVVNHAAQAITARLDLDQVLAAILEEMRTLLGVSACSVWLVEANNDIVCRQASGARSEMVRGWRLKPGEGIAGNVALSGASTIVLDTRTDLRHQRRVGHTIGMELRSILCVPVKSQERVVGVLQAVDTQPGRFTHSDLELVEMLSASATIAIENAGLYTSLRENEEKYRAVVENISDIILLMQADGALIYANQAVERLFGYPREQLIGKNPMELLHPDDSEIIRIAFQNETAANGVNNTPKRMRARHRDGSWRTLEGMAISLLDNPSIQAVMVVAQDITDRVRAEQAIQESEARYRMLIETSPDAIMLTDLDTRIILANQRTAELFGFNHAQELNGLNATDYIIPTDRERAYDNLKLAIERGSLSGAEYTMLRKDGGHFFGEITVSVLIDPGGKPRAVIAILRDITQRKEIERQIQSYTARLESLLRSASQLNAHLNLAATLHTVCEEAAHALNVPVTALYLYDQFSDTLSPASGFGIPTEEFQRMPVIPRAMYDAVAQQYGSIGELPDLAVEPLALVTDLVARSNARTLVYVSIWRDKGLIGTLNIFTMGSVRHFTNEERALLQGLADQAALAITNARLFDEQQQTQARIQRLLDQQLALNQLALALGEYTDTARVYQTLYEHVSHLMDTDGFILALCNDRSTQITAAYAVTEGQPINIYELPPLPIGPEDEGTQNQVIRSGHAMYIPNLDNVEHKLYTLQDATKSNSETHSSRPRVMSAAYVPMKVLGKTIGVIQAQSYRPSAYTTDDVELLEAVANVAATAVQNARLVEDLRHSEEKYRTIYENAIEGIFQSTPDGQFISANPAVARLLGFATPEDLIASIHDISQQLYVDPERRKEFARLTAQEGIVRGFEAQLRRKDGSIIWLSENTRAVNDADGRLLYYEGTLEDITDRKLMQTRMIHADRLSVVGRLAASVAHEINNPLQSVLGCMGLAQEALDEGGDARKYMQIARDELRRMARIVARMRDLYRPVSGEKKPTNINTLIEESLEVSRKRCQEAQVELTWQLADNLPDLLVSPDQIKQVFLNLILNALDAMPEGGKLRVSTLRDEAFPRVGVRFEDSGDGIPASTLAHIFDLFYTTKREGSGLGLSISKNIIELHGGTIEVTSQDKVGSTFTIWLPLPPAGKTA